MTKAVNHIKSGFRQIAASTAAQAAGTVHGRSRNDLRGLRVSTMAMNSAGTATAVTKMMTVCMLKLDQSVAGVAAMLTKNLITRISRPHKIALPNEGNS